MGNDTGFVAELCLTGRVAVGRTPEDAHGLQSSAAGLFVGLAFASRAAGRLFFLGGRTFFLLDMLEFARGQRYRLCRLLMFASLQQGACGDSGEPT